MCIETHDVANTTLILQWAIRFMLESLQMMGERDKETKPITAGLYTNMECGKSHVTSKKGNMSKMEG